MASDSPDPRLPAPEERLLRLEARLNVLSLQVERLERRLRLSELAGYPAGNATGEPKASASAAREAATVAPPVPPPAPEPTGPVQAASDIATEPQDTPEAERATHATTPAAPPTDVEHAGAAPARSVPARYCYPDEPLPPPARPAWAREDAARSGGEFADLLRRCGLLPPEKSDSLEVQIGTWWLTRIGMLLAIIGLVFFSAYVSRQTPPWLRLLALSAVSAGVTVLGVRLERKWPLFGRVIHAGGLALIYFTAWAAYAVPTVKVLESIAAAAVVQFAAVAGLTAVAWLRGQQPLAAMALFFGFVSCFFSTRAGLGSQSLLAAGVLLGVGVALHHLRGWQRPVLVAGFGFWLNYLGLIFLRWGPQSVEPTPWTSLGAALTALAAVLASDFVRTAVKGETVSHFVRAARVGTATVGVIATLIATALYHGLFEEVYFALGAVLLLTAAGYWVRRLEPALQHAFFIKGTALVTLGVMTAFGGRTRWMVLAVQAITLLAVTRRTRLVVTEAAALLVWLVSCGYFLSGLPPDPQDPLSLALLGTTSGGFALVYLALSTTFFAFHARWFADGSEGVGPGREIRPRFVLSLFGALLLVQLALVLSLSWTGTWLRPVTLAVLGVAVGCSALALRTWVPAAAGVAALLAANGLYWVAILGGAQLPGRWVGLNAAAIAAITIGAGLAGDAWRARHAPDAKPGFPLERLLALLPGVWLFTIAVALGWLLPREAFLAASVAVAWAALMLARLDRLHLARATVSLPLIYGLCLLARDAESLGWVLSGAKSPWPLPTALAGAGWLLLATGPWDRSLPRHLAWDRPWPAWLNAAAATLALHLALAWGFDGPPLAVATAAAALVLLVPAATLQSRPAPLAALYLLIWSHLDMYARVVEEMGRSLNVLLCAVLVAAATLFSAVFLRQLVPWAGKSDRRQAHWVGAVTSLLLVDLALLVQQGALADFVTVLWGVAAVVVFLLGLTCRARPLRLVGLGGLAICIGRAFVVDLQSTFYRIVAFIALGGALITIGFLYHRYRAYIEQLDSDAGD